MDNRPYADQLDDLISRHLNGELDEQEFDRQADELLHRCTERILIESLLSEQQVQQPSSQSNNAFSQFLHDPDWFFTRIMAISIPIMLLCLALWLSVP